MAKLEKVMKLNQDGASSLQAKIDKWLHDFSEYFQGMHKITFKWETASRRRHFT